MRILDNTEPTTGHLTTDYTMKNAYFARFCFVLLACAAIETSAQVLVQSHEFSRNLTLGGPFDPVTAPVRITKTGREVILNYGVAIRVISIAPPPAGGQWLRFGPLDVEFWPDFDAVDAESLSLVTFWSVPLPLIDKTFEVFDYSTPGKGFAFFADGYFYIGDPSSEMWFNYGSADVLFATGLCSGALAYSTNTTAIPLT